jgi:hypothetical protein
MRALPSAVPGPVESPPWKRQRPLPGSTRPAHGLPCRLRAPQRGRSLRFSGEPSPARPIARMARRLRQTTRPLRSISLKILVADAVLVEPVSNPKFPANREFHCIRPLGAILIADTRANSEACSEIPYATEQGIILEEQGILAREQGILPAKPGIVAG